MGGLLFYTQKRCLRQDRVAKESRPKPKPKPKAKSPKKRPCRGEAGEIWG